MADSAAIYSALAGKLVGDATLMALIPDGVYRDIAPHGKTSYGIVSKLDDSRAYMFGGMAFEEFMFLVKAVTATTSGLVASAAAARIFVLLQDGQMVIPGYVLMSIKEAEDNGAVEYTETDPSNADARFQHRGWTFEVQVSPT